MVGNVNKPIGNSKIAKAECLSPSPCEGLESECFQSREPSGPSHLDVEAAMREKQTESIGKHWAELCSRKTTKTKPKGRRPRSDPHTLTLGLPFIKYVILLVYFYFSKIWLLDDFKMYIGWWYVCLRHV